MENKTFKAVRESEYHKLAASTKLRQKGERWLRYVAYQNTLKYFEKLRARKEAEAAAATAK